MVHIVIHRRLITTASCTSTEANDHWRVTLTFLQRQDRWMLEEPRYILHRVCNHFFEMPENTIRNKPFVAQRIGLGTRYGEPAARRIPAGKRVKYVHEKHASTSCLICAIDKDASAADEYWVPDVSVAGFMNWSECPGDRGESAHTICGEINDSSIESRDSRLSPMKDKAGFIGLAVFWEYDVPLLVQPGFCRNRHTPEIVVKTMKLPGRISA